MSSFEQTSKIVPTLQFQEVEYKPLVSSNKYLRPSTSSSSQNRRNLVDMGFEKEIIRAGTSTKPNRGQTVTVHCTGYGKNRDLKEKFWSTKDPGQEPFKFKLGLGQVIKGWDEGVLSMSVGEIARLTCTPDYAYGAGGFPAWGIMPNSVLVFEIEVLSAQ